METIKQILCKPRGNLKIHVHNRALVLRALIATDFVLEKAILLNYKEGEKSLDSYYREILRHFPEGLQKLKTKYKEEQNK